MSPIFRPPWEDDAGGSLPALNLLRTGRLSIPQLGTWMGIDQAWRWHFPFFPYSQSAWLYLVGTSFACIRLYSIIIASLVLLIFSKACQKFAGFSSRRSWFVWLLLLLSTPSLVSLAIIGRMDFHAMLAPCLALALLAETPISLSRTFFLGLFFGCSAGFHPMALFLGPGIAWLASVQASGKSLRFHFRHLLALGAGVALVLLGVAIWFLLEIDATKTQFLGNVKGTSASSLSSSVSGVFWGLWDWTRLEPFGPVFILLALSFFLAGKRWAFFSPPDVRKIIALLLLVLGGLAYLLRGGADHGNYYLPLILSVYALAAFCAGKIWPNGKFHKLSLTALAFTALLWNFTCFFVRWDLCRQVYQKQAPERLETFWNAHAPLFLKNRIALPPKLFPEALSSGLDFRFSYLLVAGQNSTVYQDYLRDLLDWKPDYIIVDDTDWPERNFTPAQLARAGYVQTDSFNEVWIGNYRYDGYHLNIYRRTGAP